MKCSASFYNLRTNKFSSGINLEKINSGIDEKIYSVRIDNTYRGIVVKQEESDVYLLLWVDHHDEAYQWAERRRCDVNSKTGFIQIYQVSTEKIVEKRIAHGYFDFVKDEELLKLGVSDLQLEYIRSLSTLDDFYKAKENLSSDSYEHLSWLTEGYSVNDVFELMGDDINSSNTSTNISDALKNPCNLKSFIVVDGNQELEKIMEAPLEKWRVFLHPDQRKFATRDYSGSARVLGSAGTGKTVVAMHRAKYLASKIKDDEKILFTTFTANLASDIEENLKKICSSSEMKKIEVINLDAWVSQFLRKANFPNKIEYNNIDKIWEEAVLSADDELMLDSGFYREEWEKVVVSQATFTLDKYIRANRKGRGTRLDRKKRMSIWKVFERYQQIMNQNNMIDIDTTMCEATELLKSDTNKERFQYIIVDEGQDFSNNAYRLLRVLSGEEHSNDIFIVGDSHQRIYKNKPVLSRCGINVRGRSSILKINYRTTEEIRKYAFALLNGISFDNLDDETDLDERCQSLTHGDIPVVEHFNDADAEFNFILGNIEKLISSGVSLSDICVTVRTKKLADAYIEKFANAGIKSYSIKKSRNDGREYDGIRIATMHRVKGLEFKYVFVAAVNNRVVPLLSAISKVDTVSERESLTSEKCLLYVAITRAQIGVYITSYGRASEFIVGQ